MTVDDVVNLCQDVPEGTAWRLEPFGSQEAVRLVTADESSEYEARIFCPNTWACYKQCGVFYEPHEYEAAACHMGLDFTAANLIASAADANLGAAEAAALRDRLTKELKLHPQEVPDEG